MKVAVVTSSVGGRPGLLALCKKYVDRQGCVDEWILREGECDHMFIGLAIALVSVPDEYHVVVMDDDEWYAPDHVSNLVEGLEEGKQLVACTPERRYNLLARRWNFNTTLNPGPGICGIHADYVRRYTQMLYSDPPNGDVLAWNDVGLEPERRSTNVAIKGVGYGVPGIRGGQNAKKHDPSSRVVQGWNHDPELDMLREWIGDDVDVYLEMLV